MYIVKDDVLSFYDKIIFKIRDGLHKRYIIFGIVLIKIKVL